MHSLLDWKELEILKNVALKKKQTKSNIISDLKQHFNSLSNKAISSLYLIFERLEKKGLIVSRKVLGEGHKDFVHLTQKGKQKIIDSMKVSYNYLLPSILQTLVSEVQKIIELHLENKKNHTLATILPDAIINHPDFQKYSEKTLPNTMFRKFNIQMPFSGESSPPGFEYVKAKEDSIPLNDDFFDTIIAFMVLGFHEKNHYSMILEELNRLLKTGGKLILLEAKESYSIIQQSIFHITENYNFLDSVIGFKFNMFSKDNLAYLVQKTFSNYNDHEVDYAEFNVLIIEK